MRKNKTRHFECPLPKVQVKNRHIMSALYKIRELVKTMCENKNIINEYNGELRSSTV